jgi:hypothetical protein
MSSNREALLKVAAQKRDSGNINPKYSLTESQPVKNSFDEGLNPKVRYESYAMTKSK